MFRDTIASRARRRFAAFTVITAGAVVATHTGRLVNRWARSSEVRPERLEAVARSFEPREERVPTLLVLTDPTCEACLAVEDDLLAPTWARFRLRVVALRLDEAPRDVLDLGPWPSYTLFDERGTFVAELRGYRSPRALEDWALERLSLSTPRFPP